MSRVAQSVWRLATGWTVRGSNPGGGKRFSTSVQIGPEAHPASCAMGTGSFPGVKNGRGVTLTPHPLLVPWSRKSRAITLLPLRAVRPVQSLSACIKVYFTFLFYTIVRENKASSTHNLIPHTSCIRKSTKQIYFLQN